MIHPPSVTIMSMQNVRPLDLPSGAERPQRSRSSSWSLRYMQNGFSRHEPRYSLQYQTDENSFLLRLRIVGAYSLAKKDIFGASDPYVRVELQKVDGDVTLDTFITKTKKKTLNPTWNQEFVFRVKPTEHKLLIQVFDENRLTRDDFLGMVEVPLSSVPTETAASARPNVVKYPLRPRRSVARSRVRGYIEVYHALVGRVGEAGAEEPAPSDDWELVEPSPQQGVVQPLSRRNMSSESQAERMETAATEFQRRFHISADDELASSPAATHTQNHHQEDISNRSGETNSTDPTPFSTPIRSPEPVAHVADSAVTNQTNSISDETDCDNNLGNKTTQEDDDVVCANEVVGDAQTDTSTSHDAANTAADTAELTDNTNNETDNTTTADEAGGNTPPTDTPQDEGPDTTDHTEVTQDGVVTPEERNTANEGHESNERDTTNEADTENETQTEVVENETETTASEAAETETASPQTETVELQTETAVPQAEVIVEEDALTFDENHFSTPTGGASPVTTPTNRRRRTTTSSMEDSE
ncbi:hypothetical protein HF086_003602, partial [Spodoptera exigua]